MRNSHTILVNHKLKAILSKNVNVFHENAFIDGGEVKLLRPATHKEVQ